MTCDAGGIPVNILATGSTGNCVILNGDIALDMGAPYKTVEPYAKDLKLVFIGHEHSDHLKPSTIKKLATIRPTLRFCVGPWLVARLLDCGVSEKNIDVLQPDWTLNYYKEFMVRPVELAHNVPCYGLKIELENGKRIFYAVDTGTLDGVEAKNYDLYLVESNHTRAEIEERVRQKQEAGEFAYEWAAAQNHLSYEQAMEWIVENIGPTGRYIFLHQHKQKKGS